MIARAKGTSSRTRRALTRPTPRGAPKCVVCVIPRGRPVEPLKKLLPGYTLLTATSVTALRKLARREACDLFVLQTPLGWHEADAVCRNIRSYDAHTPIVVYAFQPSATERRETLAAGAQAYVGRSDDPHNLHGRVGQLVMLAELRSMEALSSNAEALHDSVSGRLQQIIQTANENRAAALDGAKTRLKVEAARLFTKAGGTRANFERLWPGIYERAFNALPKSQ